MHSTFISQLHLEHVDAEVCDTSAGHVRWQMREHWYMCKERLMGCLTPRNRARYIKVLDETVQTSPSRILNWPIDLNHADSMIQPQVTLGVNLGMVHRGVAHGTTPG